MKDQPQLSLASWLKLLARNTLAGHLMPSSAATSGDPSSAQHVLDSNRSSSHNVAST